MLTFCGNSALDSRVAARFKVTWTGLFAISSIDSSKHVSIAARATNLTQACVSEAVGGASHYKPIHESTRLRHGNIRGRASGTVEIGGGSAFARDRRFSTHAMPLL